MEILKTKNRRENEDEETKKTICDMLLTSGFRNIQSCGIGWCNIG